MARLRPGNSSEPPGADPHAGWCGGRGRKTPGYPIGHRFIAQLFVNMRYRIFPPIMSSKRIPNGTTLIRKAFPGGREDMGKV